METNKVIITKHASKRFKQRRGIPKKSMYKEVFYALTKGKSSDETKGRQKKYFKNIIKSSGQEISTRLFNGFVWIFNNNILITLYPIPGSKIINN